MSTTVIEALSRRATDRPDALAFSVEGERLSFRQLHDDAAWLARRLARAGLSRGDRCGVVLTKTLDYIRAVYAAQMLGAAPVGIDAGLAPARQLHRLAAAEPVVTLASQDVAAALAALPTRLPGTVLSFEALPMLPATPDVAAGTPGPEEIAYLQFTSGSTGEPRAAVVTHANLASGLAAMQQHFDLTTADITATWIPLHYAPGLVRYLFGTTWFGCSCHLLRPSAVNLSRWLELVGEVGATITSAPDFAYRLAARTVDPSRVDLRTLRLATNAGEAVRAGTIEMFEGRFGLERLVQPAYGLSEATLVVSSAVPGDPLLVDDTGTVSCGAALPGVEVRVADESGRPCAPLVEGEIQVRGPVVFKGYFRDETGTARAFRDGWLCTGDLAAMDAAGRLYPRSRARALIKRAGAGIAPRELEEPVERLAGVTAAAALGFRSAGGVTDDVLIVVEADVEGRRDGRDLALRVEAAVAAAIGLAPARILVVEERAIPRTPVGKIGYADLRRLAGDPAFLKAALFVS